MDLADTQHRTISSKGNGKIVRLMDQDILNFVMQMVP